MLKNQIDEFERYDRNLSNTRQEILELSNKLSLKREQEKQLKIERRDFGIQYYGEKEKRRKILDTAKQYGYSNTKIEELRPYIDNWNQDVINNGVISDFRMIEKYIEEYNNKSKPYAKNIFYKISKSFSSGGNSNED